MSEKKPAETQLQDESISPAIMALAKAIIAQQPKDPNNLGLSDEKIRELTSVPKGGKYRLVAVTSEDTGATFDAHVVESKEHPHGRITRIENYKHPKGIYTYQSNGGLVPDGFPICNEFPGQPPLNTSGEPAGSLHREYKHWRWEAFWKHDLQRFVGRGLAPSMCSPEAFRAPWLQGHYFGQAAE